MRGFLVILRKQHKQVTPTAETDKAALRASWQPGTRAPPQHESYRKEPICWLNLLEASLECFEDLLHLLWPRAGAHCPLPQRAIHPGRLCGHPSSHRVPESRTKTHSGFWIKWSAVRGAALTEEGSGDWGIVVRAPIDG